MHVLYHNWLCSGLETDAAYNGHIVIIEGKEYLLCCFVTTVAGTLDTFPHVDSLDKLVA